MIGERRFLKKELDMLGKGTLGRRRFQPGGRPATSLPQIDGSRASENCQNLLAGQMAKRVGRACRTDF